MHKLVIIIFSFGLFGCVQNGVFLTPAKTHNLLSGYRSGIYESDVVNRKILGNLESLIDHNAKVISIYKINESLWLLFVSKPIVFGTNIEYGSGMPGPYLSLYFLDRKSKSLSKSIKHQVDVVRPWLERDDATFPRNKGINLVDVNGDGFPEIVITSIYGGAGGCGAFGMLIIDFRSNYDVLLDDLGITELKRDPKSNKFQVKICNNEFSDIFFGLDCQNRFTVTNKVRPIDEMRAFVYDWGVSNYISNGLGSKRFKSISINKEISMKNSIGAQIVVSNSEYVSFFKGGVFEYDIGHKSTTLIYFPPEPHEWARRLWVSNGYLYFETFIGKFYKYDSKLCELQVL